MLQRRHFNVQGGQTCIMCNSSELETIDHLFFSCPFAKECWQKIGVIWNDSTELLDRIALAQNHNGMPWFMEIILIAAWELWKVRNDKVFQKRDPSTDRWFCNFKNQCFLNSVRFRDDLRLLFCFWLDVCS